MSDSAEAQIRGRPGRPRSARAERAIREATLALLAQDGYAGLSIEAVAARAGVGKTTIYRRWPSKDALVAAALQGLSAAAPIVDTGDVRADLTTLLRELLGMFLGQQAGRLFVRLVAEVAANPDLYAVYRSALLTPRLALFTGLLGRAVARGELRGDLDPEVAADLVVGSALARLILSGAGDLPAADYAERLVDTLLRGFGAG